MRLVERSVMFMGLETTVIMKEPELASLNPLPSAGDVDVIVQSISVESSRCCGVNSRRYSAVVVNGMKIPYPDEELLHKIMECHRGKGVMEINFK